MQISAIQPSSLDYAWHQLLPQIEKGLKHGQGDGTTPEHMLAAIRKGDMFMWVVHEGEAIKAGIVLSVNENPTGRKLWVEMLAGEGMSEWVSDLQALLTDFQKLIGATCIEASCRPGIAKLLTKQGWGKKAIIMELNT